MYLKPFIKTTLISALLFFILVFLGMKYHWIGFFKSGNDQDLVLSIPDKPTSPEPANNGVEEEMIEDKIHPEIIQTLGSGSLVENMTKVQVEENCKLLYPTESDELLLELAVGNCVLSNFSDPYQDVSLNDEGSTTSSNNHQKQTQQKNATKLCAQKADQMIYNNEIEKQLLMGICISDF